MGRRTGGLGIWLLLGGLGALVWWRRRQPAPWDLRDRTVLITGGSRGLGLVLAREFAAAGARIALCARNAHELDEARVDLEGRGATVLTVPCDVTQPAEVMALIDHVQATLGPVEVLVNNAGVITVGPLPTLTVSDVEESLLVHVFGPLYTSLAVLPGMRARQAGRIVNIASIGGKVSVPHLLAYSTGKFGLTGLSEGMRAELRREGIVVTTVCPGLMRTGSPRHAFFKGRYRAEYAWFTLLDSLPFTAMSAERAARRIVRATETGEAEVILSVSAKLLSLVHGVFPGLVSDVLAVVNDLLPKADGRGHTRVAGKEIDSPLNESWLTGLTRRAAQRNNEFAE